MCENAMTLFKKKLESEPHCTRCKSKTTILWLLKQKNTPIVAVFSAALTEQLHEYEWNNELMPAEHLHDPPRNRLSCYLDGHHVRNTP